MPSASIGRTLTLGLALLLVALPVRGPGEPVSRFVPHAAQRSDAGPSTGPGDSQPLDADYTARIREYTTDPRISTELVDSMPASGAVPSPLEFLGRIPGTPDELTYYADILRYLEALDRASDRVRLFRIGTSTEGRDLVTVVIADAATIASLERYRSVTARLTDPRVTSDEEARRLIRMGKPIYYVTGGTHAPEAGGPEMLMELAFRMAVDETPFVRAIRDQSIFAFTPVTDVDGREKMVDTFYYEKRTGRPAPPLVYWGEYAAHDNNRDALGLGLRLTRAMMETFLEWHPTVWHDLHESMPYLYTSTGAGPYNPSVDPVVTDEWWLLAKYEVSEMTKRGVPGVWTYGFHDGWAPNYLFSIANSHNSIGRFYETQGYGPGRRDVGLDPDATRVEWFRGNPTLPSIRWGPRNNVNIQQSALLLAMSYVARNKDTFLESYYLKNKRAIERGRARPPHAWLIRADQRRRVEAVELVNLIRRQGAEVHVLDTPLDARVTASVGDFVVRMDQPYRTIVDILLGTQRYPASAPPPYDDTGWTLPMLRNVQVESVSDASILDHPMTRLAEDVRVAGEVTGRGSFLLVDHTTDGVLATFRFAHPEVEMQAAERAFEADGRSFGPGAIIVDDPDGSTLDRSLVDLGLEAHRVELRPAVKVHDLDPPRIGFVHSWITTQDEGWVRLAFDRFQVPYSYFADPKLRTRNLRARYDVIVFPHLGEPPHVQVAGVPATGEPIPYRRSALTPHLGVLDSSEDIRGGMGLEGLANLVTFVHAGGTLIVEGSTSALLPAYGVVRGVEFEQPGRLVAPGSVLRAEFVDPRSPIAYGYQEMSLPVYFDTGPVIRVRGESAEPSGSAPEPRPSAHAELDAILRRLGVVPESRAPRVIMRFPEEEGRILQSGLLVGGKRWRAARSRSTSRWGGATS